VTDLTPQHDRSSQAGFSLFESLVALAVFSLAAISTLTLINQNLQSAGLLEARTYAGFVADNVLVETRLAQSLVQGETTGETRMGGFVFRWERLVFETGQGDLSQVNVKVFMTDRRQAMAIRYGYSRG
jgi:general secretion pathway protein I